jgi:hypothetical protein
MLMLFCPNSSQPSAASWSDPRRHGLDTMLLHLWVGTPPPTLLDILFMKVAPWGVTWPTSAVDGMELQLLF